MHQGIGDRAVGIRDNHIVDLGIKEALEMPIRFNKTLYDIADMLARN